MRIARYTTGEDPTYGIVQGDPGHELVAEIQGDPLYQPVVPTGVQVPLSEVRLLAPVIPRSKVVGIGKNYADHAAEMGGEAAGRAADVPHAQHRGRRPGRPDRACPRQSTDVHYEGELAVVIGRICKDVPLERVEDVVYGYTCANDVTARDLQRADGQWARAKGFDTFCPLGPWIETELDVSDLSLVTRRDGEIVQDGTHRRHDPRRRRPWSPTSRRPSRCCPATSSSPARPPVSARSSAASGSRSRSRASAPCPTPIRRD